MESIPNVTLSSSNVTIPVIGLGTAVPGLAGSEDLKDAILNSIELGYRHFDSASVYHSEQPLGEAIAEALARGLIKSRDELFITSKLWCCDAIHDSVLPALQMSLRNLGLEYLDLYLIHWPVSSKEPGEYAFPMNKENLIPMDFKSTWEAMEECQKLGLVKSIGVSNFSCKKLSDLLSVATIPPAVNQVEMNVVWQQKKLKEFCVSKGILLAAFSPLGAKGTTWGGGHVMDNDVLREVAEARGKTVAQVALRWLYEQGVIVVVKSFSKERMKENLEIFDWELMEEDNQKISKIPQQRGHLGGELISDDGPYKTLDELWDGEI